MTGAVGSAVTAGSVKNASPGVQDQGGRVRQGEELDLPKVDAWIKTQVPALQGAPDP